MKDDGRAFIIGRSQFAESAVPFILAAVALLVAIVYGAVRLYQTVAVQFGTAAAVITLLACIAIVAWLIVSAVRRYRAVHGVRAGGERILSLDGPWGALRIDADKKMGTLSVDARETRFVFSDVVSATPAQDGQRWTLALQLAHNAQPAWTVPMPDRGTALRWAKIFRLANSHKL